jgi:hypothetical protein
LNTGIARQLARVHLDLSVADAERADPPMDPPRVRQHVGAEPGARADTDDMRLGDAPLDSSSGSDLACASICE